MSLFKHAYARGINDELIRHGIVRYASKVAADEIADAVGDQMPVDPAAEEMAPEGGGAPVSPETAAEVAATLVESANKLIEETAGAGLAEEGVPPMEEEAEVKTSAAQDLSTRAHNQGYAVMVKSAEEAKHAMGSTIEGGDKGNTMADATAAETAMEARNRPPGEYVKGVTGVGQTSSPAGRGTGVVGSEQVPAPDAPGESPAGSNTVIQQSKMGALQSIIQKVAMGSTIEGGDKGNTMGEAPAAETQMEATNRPEGYATNSLGMTQLPVTPAATVGTEQPQPEAPKASPPGSLPGEGGNSVVDFSAEAKTGGADPFIALFKKTADEVAQFLPTNCSDEQKIAHVRQMMGLTESERNNYIGLLQKEAGATNDEAVAIVEKHAACSRRTRHSGNPGRQDRTKANQKTAMSDNQEKLPPALKAAIENKKADDKGEVGAEESVAPSKDKKDKDDDEAKEGADLLSRIRTISQSVRA